MGQTLTIVVISRGSQIDAFSNEFSRLRALKAMEHASLSGVNG